MAGDKVAVQDKITDLVQAILEGCTEAQAIAVAREEWGETKRNAEKLVDQAFAELEALGRQDREKAFGVAMGRYHALFASAVKIQDYKTALQVQRQIDRLNGL